MEERSLRINKMIERRRGKNQRDFQNQKNESPVTNIKKKDNQLKLKLYTGDNNRKYRKIRK